MESFEEGTEIVRVYLAAALAEAKAIEDALTAAGVDFAVEVEEFAARTALGIAARRGAGFWIREADADLAGDGCGDARGDLLRGFTEDLVDGGGAGGAGHRIAPCRGLRRIVYLGPLSTRFWGGNARLAIAGRPSGVLSCPAARPARRRSGGGRAGAPPRRAGPAPARAPGGADPLAASARAPARCGW